jgi:ubiquinone/menaquinone biosynthesis C-methylase UbiE
MNFKDHFSRHAGDYVRYRPEYPDSLFDFLGKAVKHHELAWDSGTGNGQAARGLAAHFDRVIATDPSAEQIHHAVPHEKITYLVAAAEHSEIPSHTVDLITVAQAVHWFDLPRFYQEARRVLKPDGALAVWCYGLTQITPEIDAVVQHYYNNIVGPFWPPQRRYIDEKYETLLFPFVEFPVPEMQMKVQWNLHEFTGYLQTWSATKRFIEKHDQNPLDLVHPLLEKSWGDSGKRQTVHWPTHLRLGRMSAK